MKMTLTRAMVDELMASEVETYMADPAGDHNPGRKPFVEAVVAAFDRMGRTGQTATLTLTDEALTYAAHNGYGPFATRADILADWGPEYASLSRAFQRRQQQAAAALRADR